MTAHWLRLREALITRLRRPGHECPDEDPEHGQGMVEYALILVLIAVVVIVILTVIGKQVNNVFSNVSCGLAQCNP